jgi:hypothetical protein
MRLLELRHALEPHPTQEAAALKAERLMLKFFLNDV